jgi:hypothetical protein
MVPALLRAGVLAARHDEDTIGLMVRSRAGGTFLEDRADDAAQKVPARFDTAPAAQFLGLHDVIVK